MLWLVVGPFEAIGAIICGPIRGHRCNNLWPVVGPCKAISTIFSGPIRGHQHHILELAVGPFVAISTIFYSQWWAHPRQLAPSFMVSGGPIQGPWQSFYLPTVGPSMGFI